MTVTKFEPFFFGPSIAFISSHGSVCFLCVEVKGPSQQFFIHVGTVPPLPGYYQYFREVLRMGYVYKLLILFYCDKVKFEKKINTNNNSNLYNKSFTFNVNLHAGSWNIFLSKALLIRMIFQ